MFSFAALLHQIYPFVSSHVWRLLLLFSYLTVALVGIAVQRLKKYRSHLARALGVDRSDIIKFAFTWGQLAQLHLRVFKAKLREERYNATSAISPL